MAIVRVALPLPLPQVFDYTAEDAGVEDVGRCVKVPFGRGERTGLIVGLADAIVDLAPGDYPVVLDHYAMVDLTDMLGYLGFSALAVQEER